MVVEGGAPEGAPALCSDLPRAVLQGVKVNRAPAIHRGATLEPLSTGRK